MWVAKLSFDGRDGIFGSRTFKHKVNLFGFPLSYSYGKSWITVNATGIIVSEEKNKRSFIREIKKISRIKKIEFNKDFFIMTYLEPGFAKGIYNQNIIHIAPVLIDENGTETLTVASFEKKHLLKAITAIKSRWKIKIHFIQQRKVKNISIIHENPKLTDKQKQAINLAIKHGYYKYPRKIELEKLARLMKISYSTYQAHLRKAEQKLIPFFFEK